MKVNANATWDNLFDDFFVVQVVAETIICPNAPLQINSLPTQQNHIVLWLIFGHKRFRRADLNHFYQIRKSILKP